jgi:hypothetical protein
MSSAHLADYQATCVGVLGFFFRTVLEPHEGWRAICEFEGFGRMNVSLNRGTNLSAQPADWHTS